TFDRKGGGQVHGAGGLANAALLVDKRHDARRTGLGWRVRAGSGGVRRFGGQGWPVVARATAAVRRCGRGTGNEQDAGSRSLGNASTFAGLRSNGESNLGAGHAPVVRPRGFFLTATPTMTDGPAHGRSVQV